MSYEGNRFSQPGQVSGGGAQPAAFGQPQPAPQAPQPPPNLQGPAGSTTLGVNQNAPSFAGTGTFHAQPYAINDLAITGQPTVGASGNYGLNDVWSRIQQALSANNLKNYQATAPTAGYAMAGPTNISTAGDAAWQSQQQQLANVLGRQAAGGGVSPADIQLQQGADRSLAGQLSALGSQRGGGSGDPALAARMAAEMGASNSANLNQQMGLQRAQETLQAQGALGSVLGTARGQAQAYNANEAQLEQQNAQFNAANAQQSGLADLNQAGAFGLADQAAAQAAQNQKFQQLMSLLGAGTGVSESDRAAALANQQLQVQQQNAVNQVNAGAYESGAQANANLTSSLFNTGAGLVGTAINAAAGSGGGGSSGSSSNASWQSGQGAGADNASQSDQNVKTGISGGNPMLQSFLEQYYNDSGAGAASKANPIDVNSGLNFHGPTITTSQSNSGTGKKLGSTVGGVAGGAVGSAIAPGIGTAIGSAIGSALGGLFGGAGDKTTTTRQVTALPSGYQPIGGISDMDSMNELSGLPSGQTGDVWSKMQGALGGAPPNQGMPYSLSDDNAKQNIQSGNAGMNAFLSQQNAQAQAGAAPTFGSSRGQSPGWQLDRQMPQPGSLGAPGLPPWVPQNSGAGYGAPAGDEGLSFGGQTQGVTFPGQSTWADTSPSGPDTWRLPPSGPSYAGSLTNLPAYTGSGGAPPSSTGVNGGLVNQFRADTTPNPFASTIATPANSVAQAFLAMQPQASDERAKTDVANPESDDVQRFLDAVHAHSYRYKDPDAPGAGHGTFVSPMAQEMEKTPLGKSFVFDGPDGHKMVDYGKMSGTLLAAQAMLNERLNDHEAMIRSLGGRQ